MKEDKAHDPVSWGPLVFHIRSLRQWFGLEGMSQRELAEITGMSPRQVRAYENCRALPRLALTLLRFALALNVPLEWLFIQSIVDKERARIEDRKKRLAKSSSESRSGRNDIGV